MDTLQRSTSQNRFPWWKTCQQGMHSSREWHRSDSDHVDGRRGGNGPRLADLVRVRRVVAEVVAGGRAVGPGGSEAERWDQRKACVALIPAW